MVVFALNDNPDPSAAEGGCHWSLVVYSRSAPHYSFHTSPTPNPVFDPTLAFAYFICYRLDWVGGHGSFVGSTSRSWGSMRVILQASECVRALWQSRRTERSRCSAFCQQNQAAHGWVNSQFDFLAFASKHKANMRIKTTYISLRIVIRFMGLHMVKRAK